MSKKKRKGKLLDEPVQPVETIEAREPALPPIEDQDDEVYLPPRVNLDGLTKEQLATLSMRHFGVRPDPTALKDAQVAEVRRRMRAGRPSYMS